MLALACSSSLACLRPLRALRAEQSLSTQAPSGVQGEASAQRAMLVVREPHPPPLSSKERG